MEALNNTLKSVAVRYMLWLEWVTRWDGDRDREFCSFLRFHKHNYCSARTGTWNALIMQKKQTKRKRELSVWNFILLNSLPLPLVSTRTCCFHFSLLIVFIYFAYLPDFFFFTCQASIVCLTYMYTDTHIQFCSDML